MPLPPNRYNRNDRYNSPKGTLPPPPCRTRAHTFRGGLTAILQHTDPGLYARGPSP
jgi:hypothetical protein